MIRAHTHTPFWYVRLRSVRWTSCKPIEKEEQMTLLRFAAIRCVCGKQNAMWLYCEEQHTIKLRFLSYYTHSVATLIRSLSKLKLLSSQTLVYEQRTNYTHTQTPNHWQTIPHMNAYAFAVACSVLFVSSVVQNICDAYYWCVRTLTHIQTHASHSWA